MPRRPGPWLVAAAVALAAILAWWTVPETPPPLGRGSRAPDFTLPRLTGAPVDLDALRGRVVLINFWATWCKPCEDEMPAMDRLYRRLQGRGFELLAVSVDDARSDVESFQERLQLSFPILLDRSKQVATAYQTFRFPESFLIGPDGVIVERYIGPREWDAAAYVTRIERLLVRSS